MSKVIIKNINLPNSCMVCRCKVGLGKNSLHCKLLHRDIVKHTNDRHPDCPFIEMRTKHGRLIDADRLLAVIKSAAGNVDSVSLSSVLKSIENAPTVVGADCK